MESDRDKFAELAKATLGALAHLVKLLMDLPIPIAIPNPLEADEADVEVLEGAVFALERAQDLIDAEPISELRKEYLQRMCLDWFTAYEMVALIKVAGPAPWRFRCVEYALIRYQAHVELLEEDGDANGG